MLDFHIRYSWISHDDSIIKHKYVNKYYESVGNIIHSWKQCNLFNTIFDGGGVKYIQTYFQTFQIF